MLLILVAVYRSPILPFLVLAVAGIGLGMANGVAYLMAKAGGSPSPARCRASSTCSSSGAGTDYALLLASRFREELRRTEDKYEAMRVAWRASVEPIAASGGTVILAVLCLLVSGLPATRSLGPVAAIGIGFAVLSMLVLLPAALLLLGRAAFWPFRPAVGSTPPSARGAGPGSPAWSAGGRGRSGRGTLLVLLILAAGVFQLQASGIPRTSGFLTPCRLGRRPEGAGGQLPGRLRHPDRHHRPGRQARPPMVAAAQAVPQRAPRSSPTWTRWRSSTPARRQPARRRRS